MKIQILPSGSASGTLQYLTSFIVNRSVAIDAGSIGLLGQPADQSRIEHVFLTHTHADHVGTLPVFVENRDAEALRIYGHPFVLESLKTDVFNGRVWPDLLNSHPGESSTITVVPLQSERPVSGAGLTITPVEVDHIVPTFGYIVEDDASAVVFGADSGPTERIWELARRRSNLQAVFLEASFPDRMLDHARATCHLTPGLLRQEAAKLPAQVSVVAVHIKPRFHDEVREDLESLRMDNLIVGMGGTTYSF